MPNPEQFSTKKIEMPDFVAANTALAEMAQYPEEIQQQILANLLARRSITGTFAERIINAIVSTGAGSTAPSWNASDALSTKDGADAQAVARAFYGESARQAKGNTYRAGENVFKIIIDTAASELRNTTYTVDNGFLRFNSVMNEARDEIDNKANWRLFSTELARILTLPHATVLAELTTSRTTGVINGIIPSANPLSQDIQDAVESYIENEHPGDPSNRDRAMLSVLQDPRADITAYFGVQSSQIETQEIPLDTQQPAMPAQYSFANPASPRQSVRQEDLSWRVTDDVRIHLGNIARNIETLYGRGVAELAFEKMLKDRGVDAQIIKDASALLVNPIRRVGARSNERDALDKIGTILQAPGNIDRIRELVEDAVAQDARDSAAEFVKKREFSDILNQLRVRRFTTSSARKESLQEVPEILRRAVEDTLVQGQNRRLPDVLNSLVDYGAGQIPDSILNEVGTNPPGGGSPILEMLAYRLFEYTQDRGPERNRRLKQILSPQTPMPKPVFDIGRKATPLSIPTLARTEGPDALLAQVNSFDTNNDGHINAMNEMLDRPNLDLRVINAIIAKLESGGTA